MNPKEITANEYLSLISQLPNPSEYMERCGVKTPVALVLLKMPLDMTVSYRDKRDSEKHVLVKETFIFELVTHLTEIPFWQPQDNLLITKIQKP